MTAADRATDRSPGPGTEQTAANCTLPRIVGVGAARES
jgi:hypothetical protein